MKHLKVKDQPKLVRDATSKAILNTGTKELENYRKGREQALKINKMLKEFDELKAKVEYLEDIIHKFVVLP